MQGGLMCLNIPIQVLLCSQRHFCIRGYVWGFSAIKLIVRTQECPNLTPQMMIFPRGVPGGLWKFWAAERHCVTVQLVAALDIQYSK